MPVRSLRCLFAIKMLNRTNVRPNWVDSIEQVFALLALAVGVFSVEAAAANFKREQGFVLFTFQCNYYVVALVSSR